MSIRTALETAPNTMARVKVTKGDFFYYWSEGVDSQSIHVFQEDAVGEIQKVEGDAFTALEAEKVIAQYHETIQGRFNDYLPFEDVFYVSKKLLSDTLE